MDGKRCRGVIMDMAVLDDAYLGLDLVGTGRRLGELIGKSGISVKRIQNILHLSCPQPVYRWMRGQMLPTVEHLYILAKLFSVHMEELLVQKGGNREEICFCIEPCYAERLKIYRRHCLDRTF